jgi:preprotein translocase subunit Sec63
MPPALEAFLIEAGRELLDRACSRWLPRDVVSSRSSNAAASPPPKSDPYRVLGLRRDATAADVKKRRKQLAQIFHSDVKDGDPDKMAEINEAASVLLRKLAAPTP